MSIKIAITGPESSGKTTLAKELADRLNGMLVEEYARTFLEGKDIKPELNDLVHICGKQIAAEDIAETSGKSVVCDTDMLVLKVWADIVFGQVPEEIERAYNSRFYDITLLCKPDLKWESDPLRSAPTLVARQALFEIYERNLIDSKRPYYIIEGQGKSRLEAALKKINGLF